MQKKARELGLFGFVRNEADKSVLIEVEGERGKIDRLIEWCKTGPKTARVEFVEVEEGKWAGFSAFTVEY